MTDFDPAAFAGALTTSALGRYLVYRPEVESTMPLARREAAEGAPSGTLVLAEVQTAGRGRQGRGFWSPPGNLYFTLVLRLPVAVHRHLPVAVPLAVCQACRETGVDCAIKWPNDIWAAGRKLCGILIDAVSSPEPEQGFLAYPGIGINVNADPTGRPELAGIATSIARELGGPIRREALLAAVCNRLEAALEMPEAGLLAAYRELSLVLGRNVTIEPRDPGATPYEALALDLDSTGALVVEPLDRADTRVTLTAANVSLRPA